MDNNQTNNTNPVVAPTTQTKDAPINRLTNKKFSIEEPDIDDPALNAAEPEVPSSSSMDSYDTLVTASSAEGSTSTSSQPAQQTGDQPQQQTGNITF